MTADLTFEVDGAAGTVRADGGVVRVDLDDPLAAFRGAGAYGGRSDVAFAAAALSASGVTVEVHGPAGRVATVGAGVDSRLGRVLTGSRAVSARPLALAPVRAREAVAFAAAAVVALFAVRRFR